MKKHLIVKILVASLILCVGTILLVALLNIERHDHIFDQKVTTENFVASNATCVERAKYYFSCTCGQKGDETFTYGDLGDHEQYDEVFILTGCNYEVSYKARVCKHCLETQSIESGDIVVHPHSWILADPIAPTCTQMGYNAHFVCEYCGAEVVGQAVAPLGHIGSGSYYDNDTNHYRYCSRSNCGEKVYSSHNYNWTVTKYPTCIENGSKNGKCSLCGNDTVQNILSGHIWNNGEVILEPKCTTEGEKLCTCIVCGETKTLVIAPLGHDWDGGIIIKEATCYEKGEKLYTCLRCGEQEKRNYGYSHNWVSIIVKQKTCYEDGALYKKCTICGLEETETIPASHGERIEEKVPATCLDWGYYKEVCSICDAVLNERYLKPKGHNLTVAYNETTHWQECTNCNYKEPKRAHTLTLKSITEIIDDDAQIVYKHSLFDVCTYEGCEYKKQYGEWKTSIHYATKIFEGIQATCTEPGLTPGLKCGVYGCNEIFVEQEELPSLGHEWHKGNCKRCGETQLEMKLSSDGQYYTVISEGEFVGDELEMPSFYNGLPVRNIATQAFHQCNNLICVTFKENSQMLDIGFGAFSYCKKLTNINIPSNVLKIGNAAFSNSDKLTSITVDEGNTNYKSIDGNLYSKDGKTLIQYAIGKKEDSFVVPNTVTSIGDYAFSSCYSIKNITISDNVTSMGDSIFLYCHALESVTMPKNITKIGSSTFFGCHNLTNIIIPNDVTNIGDYAFYGCSLSRITITKNITNIGAGAFQSCHSLESIIVEEDNQNYKSIDGNLYSKDGKTLIQYAIGKKEDSFVVPSTVTSIGDSAFYASKLSNITIPNSIIDIGFDPFAANYNLNCNITNNLKYLGNSSNPYLYLVGVTSSDITSASIDENCKIIGTAAFKDCENLLIVEIPNTVTSIGEYSFEYCLSLKKVIFKNDSQLTSIDYNAFFGCSSLESVILPNKLTSIGSQAFDNCTSLTKVYYKGTVSDWAKISISSYNTDLENATNYFYSESDPHTTGNYWHYDENGNVVVW